LCSFWPPRHSATLFKELDVGVNHACPGGFTALYIAAQSKHLKMVWGLVEELGVDVNEPKNEGRTPLMLASYLKCDKIVKDLIKHGTNARSLTPADENTVDVS
jgi:ankyrin repeat protein